MNDKELIKELYNNIDNIKYDRVKIISDSAMEIDINDCQFIITVNRIG